MALITLICPHCGGNFELDRERTLQPFLTCPYCGNRSLMQKNEDNIRLRGIIPGKGQPSAPILQTPENADDTAEISTDSWRSPTTAHAARSLEDIIAEAQTDIYPEHPAMAAAAPEIPDSSTDLQATTLVEHEPVMITHAHEASEKREEIPIGPIVPEAPHESDGAQPSIKAAVSVPAGEAQEIDRLCHLAEDAAARHDLPLFNTYSRLALDCQPKDPRIYALRARLSEEADGFARATWTMPTWIMLTPRQKKAIVAQQLYQLNSALKYSRPEQQDELIHQFSWQLLRQALDFFTEQAEIRCSQNLFFKTFKGRFHRADIRSASRFADAVRFVDKQTCPLAWEDLLNAIRKELRQAPAKIAKKLRRI